jgi:plastocyanin
MWKCLSLFLSLALIAALLVSSGCGSSDQSDSRMERALAELEAREAEEVGVTGEILFEAHWTKTYSFTAPKAKTEAGKIKVGFTNPQKMPQNIAFEDSRGQVVGETEPVTKGTATLVANFSPGVYHYFSSLPGNREKGMEGTLVVTK